VQGGEVTGAEPSRAGASAVVAASGSVLGQPARRHGSADFPAVAVLVAEVGEGLLGLLGLAEAHQGQQQPRSRRRHEVVRCGEKPLSRSTARKAASASASRPRASSSSPRTEWTLTPAAGSASGLTVRSARWTQGSASSGRPCPVSAPRVSGGELAAGSSVQPCVRPARTACLPRSAPRVYDRETSIAA